MELVISYTTPTYNPNKPLGNNPIPLGLQPIEGQFSGIITGATSMISRNLPVGLEFQDLIYWNPNSYAKFFNDYGAYNNSIYIRTEYDRIHTFGITEFPAMPSDKRGITYPINWFDMNEPAMSFANVGRIDSVLKVNPGLPDDKRKKYITLVTAHEISHGRGLVDDNYANPSDTADDVHFGHGLDFPWCNMQWLTVYWDPSEIDNRYPPQFCCRHKKIFKDSVGSVIRKHLSMPYHFGLPCN